MSLNILITKPSHDYELLDSGNGQKLERFGEVVLARPDPQALWLPRLSEDVWSKAGATFVNGANGKGVWKIRQTVPQKWQIELAGLNFWIRPSSFKHTGLFPEQIPNWNWIGETVAKAKAEMDKEKGGAAGAKVSVLNLFGYAGGATLAASKAGAEVVHVDGSKVAINWGKDNAEISGLAKNPIRWILDDAVTFVEREIKRGNTYDGIIMDPPAFGHGADGEVWKIEDDFLKLMSLVKKLLKPSPLFILVNGYASGYSALVYREAINTLTKDLKGELEAGELSIEESESGVSGSQNRLLPAGIFARWHRS